MNFESAHSHHTKLQEGGRIVIPAPMRKALGITSGDSVVLRLENERLQVYSLKSAVQRAQSLVARYDKRRGKKGSVVDEFIAERRREAKREFEE